MKAVEVVEAIQPEFDHSREYDRYIKSDSWKAKRRQYFKEFGDDCKGCGERVDHIHVHHKTYERFGNEDLADLVSVCEACHALIHERHRLGGISLEGATNSVLARIRGHKKIILEVRRRPRRAKKPGVGQARANPSSKKFRRAAANAVSGTRRSSTPSTSWQARNEEYARLRQREEARRRTA